MSLDRHQARILAMQLLAQLDAQGDSFLDEFDAFMDASESAPARATRVYAADLARRSWGARQMWDRRIRSVAQHWSLERMSPVDRNVIRLAVVELEAGTVPPRVVMDEAIEISREYGSLESPRFVNGVLDALYKQQSAAGGEDTA